MRYPLPNQPEFTRYLSLTGKAFLLLLLAWTTHCTTSESDLADSGHYTIQVAAGQFDRSNVVVSFQFPQPVSPGTYQMSNRDGASVTLQVDNRNTGWFILEELGAGAEATYYFDETATTAREGEASGSAGNRMHEAESPARDTQQRNEVSTGLDDNTIVFSSGGRPVLSYFHGENNPPGDLDPTYRRGGYIHPVYSPRGVMLTTHLNPEEHTHHSGIWAAWTNTRYQGNTPDFWNFQLETGRVDIDSMEAFWEGSVHGGFRSKHRYVDLTGSEPVTALNEQWVVRVYRLPDAADIHVFDLELTQTVNSDRPLVLPEYRYGGLAVRGHVQWNDPDNGFFLTSGGLDREGHGTRGRWAHLGGHTDGQLAGITTMDHPSNYRFPQTMRIHPERAYFNYAPMQLGEMTINPGTPYVARYRFVTYDGAPDPDKINRIWNDFAYPPGVTVSAPPSRSHPPSSI